MQGDIFCKWPTKFECLFCTVMYDGCLYIRSSDQWKRLQMLWPLMGLCCKVRV